MGTDDPIAAAGGSGHRPRMSAERAAQIRRWHERADAEGRAAGAATREFDYLGLTIVVPPEVMPITPVSHLLGEQVLAYAREGGRVLDMGTGSGVNAILAATRGASVLAVDVNEAALDAARANAARNGVADLVEVRRSDVFSSVEGRFDLIVFDPPFRWFPARDRFEAASTDGGYRAMTAFFRGAREHLEPAGEMLVFFGSSGDIDYLYELMAAAGFGWEVVALDGGERDGWPVEYRTHLVR